MYEIPIVAIPGIGSGFEMFDPVSGRLEGAAVVVGWDLPGYGQAPAMAGYGFADLARLLADDMTAKGHERIVPFGHSIGGMVAIEFALTYPERTRALILSGTTPAFGGRDPAFAEQFLAARLGPLDAGRSMAELAASSARDLVGSGARPEAAALIVRHMSAVPEAAYRAAMTCLITFNRRDDIARLACPVLLIAGEEDRNAPLKTMQKMAETIEDACLVVLPATGHMAPIEAPDAVAAAIATFLEDIEA